MRERKFTRRTMLRRSAHAAAAAALAGCLPIQHNKRIHMKSFNVREYGAAGDGRSLDSPAIQKAIDAAAASASADNPVRVLIPKGLFTIGTIHLRSHMDFHLEEGARLTLSPDVAHYRAHPGVIAEGFAGSEAAVVADDAVGLKISGPGIIDGRSLQFMDHYEEENEWWIPKDFRPRLVVLTNCRDLEVRDVTLADSAIWTLHLIGCEHALIEHVKVRNRLDVPNSDGIDPDHCRDVEIRNCDVLCGDDAIVVKATRGAGGPGRRFGACENIIVKDCIIETQDCGLKIGSETWSDIRNIRFERCKFKTCSRGIGIILRDEGSVYDILYKDIEFTSRYYSDPWWGRGEPISLTAIPRNPDSKLGTIHNIRIENVTARCENSARIDGTAQSRIRDVTLQNVSLTLDRWTKYKGNLFDSRPTTAQPGIEPHGTPGFCVRRADNVALNNCRVAWGANIPDYFTHALEAQDAKNLTYPAFTGNAAHPDRDKAIVIS
ncbi:MAG TPA: glycosyl hydrolase family 28 protein [Phycisphaerae bacterium]|nr:glycosyl hydrolase family 28 protein [Phycisphaerae bacterium]